MRSLIAMLALIAGLFLAGIATADPSSPDKGCHGYYATQFKELTGDRGIQGQAIGGKGNSDGNPDNGQAHSEPGRGELLQAFLAQFCDVGSQK